MTVLQGILLGFIQGIAEFLPISSSGHLKVVRLLMERLHGAGFADISSDALLLFDVFLHLATLLAVVLYFRRVIWRLLCVLGRWIARRPAPAAAEGLPPERAEQQGRTIILMILLTTLVTGVLGVVSAKLLPSFSIKAVCVGFLFTALLLVASSVVDKLIALHYAASSGVRGDRPYSGIRWWQALIVGVAQGVGTLPGVSRSGSTIAGALFCGVDRVTAGDYSFLVSIPAIVGAFLLELKDLDTVANSVGALPVLAGCVAAFVAGYAALSWLMRLIHKGRLEWFALYLVPLGILGLIFF